MKRQVAIEIISLLFIFLFVYAAVSKLFDPDKFRLQIGQSPILTSVASITVWFIPILEIAISILLAVPRFRLTGLLASFGLMVMFTAYIISILQFSEDIPCACGGVLQSMGWTTHLIFNIVFILISLSGITLLGRTIKKGASDHSAVNL